MQIQKLANIKKKLLGKCPENSLKISIGCNIFNFQPEILKKIRHCQLGKVNGHLKNIKKLALPV